MADHTIKCWSHNFRALWCGDKNFLIETWDPEHPFTERDEVRIEEYMGIPGAEDEEYMGRAIEGFITYVSSENVQNGYLSFSFREIRRVEE